MTHNRIAPLSARLSTAERFVREGGFLADIGTDHAYLPLYLIKKGRIRGAVAADIAKGPLAIATRHIEQEGLSDRIATCLSDGLEKLEAYHPTDIAIFGMGGELIADILHRAPWTKAPHIRLILQPMTKMTELRRFLAENGFCILDECLSKDSGRIYQTICAEYDGVVRRFEPLTLAYGEHILDGRDPLLDELLCREQRILQTIIQGKDSANADTEAEQSLLQAIQSYTKGDSL